MRKRENLVASPKTRGRRPVANGSSVPVWPPFAAASTRFAAARARVDVIPAGLSSRRTPSGVALNDIRAGLFARGAARAAFRFRRLRLDRFVDELGEAHAALHGLIVGKRDCRNRACAQAVREARTKETRGALQSFERIAAVGFGAERGEEHLGMGLVARELDAGERHQPDAGVAHLQPDELGELALDLVGDARAP